MDDYRGLCGTGKYPLINAMKQELAGYTVKLEYDGPYEATGRNAVYTTKDRNYISKHYEYIIIFVKLLLLFNYIIIMMNRKFIAIKNIFSSQYKSNFCCILLIILITKNLNIIIIIYKYIMYNTI
jgi:hypothetical protein